MKYPMFVIGTRPEVIKVAPVVAEIQRRNIPHVIVATGQHWDDAMFSSIVEDIGMRFPDVMLGNLIKARNIEQIAYGMLVLEKEINEYNPDIVIAQGDTNTVLAACLTANKMLIPFAHIESGLRSFDWRMMEEQNRVLVDHASQWMFAPTRVAMNNLLEEGIGKGNFPPKIQNVLQECGIVTEIFRAAKSEVRHVFLTGCTAVDALLSVQTESISVPDEDYCLVTIHRRENTDYPERIIPQLQALNDINCQLPVIFPVHPRTRKLAEKHCDFYLYQPMGYIEFLAYQKNASVIVTDSGGVQQEASIFGVPCVTLRDNTERPETIEARVNRLVSPDKEMIVGAVMGSSRLEIDPVSLYGDGRAAKKIVDVLEAV